MFTLFHSKDSLLGVINQFETYAVNDSKMTLSTTRSMVPHIRCSIGHCVLNFIHFCSKTCCLGVKGYFEKSAGNNLKVMLNTARSKVHYWPQCLIEICLYVCVCGGWGGGGVWVSFLANIRIVALSFYFSVNKTRFRFCLLCVWSFITPKTVNRLIVALIVYI